MTAVLEGNQATDASPVSAAELLSGGLQPGSVVVMPYQDGGGRGWLVVEEGEGDQRYCAVVSILAGAVLAVGLVSEIKIARPAATDVAVPEWAPLLAELAWKARKAEADRDAARAALVAQEARLEVIVDAAHEYADDNDLCERFDRFMESQGLRPRKGEYDCEVDVTVRVVVKVTARSAEAAREDIDADALADVINNMASWDVRNAIEGHEVTDVCQA